MTTHSHTVCSSLGLCAYSRPTAVNLLDTARKLSALLKDASSAPGASAASVTSSVIDFAEKMQQEDIDANMAIGAFGMQAMLAAAGTATSGQISVLTHCNTGSLATARYGTALGCIRALWDAGNLEHAFCTETRCCSSPQHASYATANSLLLIPLNCAVELIARVYNLVSFEHSLLLPPTVIRLRDSTQGGRGQCQTRLL